MTSQETGLKVQHPLLEKREETNRSILLVLTSNRGLCGGYNGNVIRLANGRWDEVTGGNSEISTAELEISGKRGLSAFKYRGVTPDQSFTHFEDKPRFDEVEVLANRYLEQYIAGDLDRLDVVYTKFVTAAKQQATIETLLPLGSLGEEDDDDSTASGDSMYEFRALCREHFGRSCSDEFQSKVVQVFS